MLGVECFVENFIKIIEFCNNKLSDVCAVMTLFFNIIVIILIIKVPEVERKKNVSHFKNIT